MSLTSYAGTHVATARIDDIGLDYDLVKPCDPTGQRLCRVFDDLLGGKRARHPAFEGIGVLRSQRSPRSHAAREFLARNRVSYQWGDIDHDGRASWPRRRWRWPSMRGCAGPSRAPAARRRDRGRRSGGLAGTSSTIERDLGSPPA